MSDLRCDDDLLSVVQANEDCVLRLTSVRSGSTPGDLYLADPSIVLTADCQSVSSPFRVGAEGPTAFYANAHLSALGFAEPFHISILSSEDTRFTDVSLTVSTDVHDAGPE
jgi:hypothetical protein